MAEQDLTIISWNVNGLRACGRKGFLQFLQQTAAQVVCVQEIKATPQQLEAELRSPPGWQSHFVPAERPGYSGVAVYSRLPLANFSASLGRPEFDVEGRFMRFELNDLLVVNAYFPNGSGKNRDNSRIPYKLEFYEHLFNTLEKETQARPVVVVGDYNTAHADIDLARPKQNHKTSGFTPIERQAFAQVLQQGWTDTFRHHCAEPEHYSWWSNRAGVREKNIGWRIDYALANPLAMAYVRGAFIQPQVYGSDHCPVGVTLKGMA